MKDEKDHTKTYLLLYVDDMLIASVNKAAIEELKSKFNYEVEMKDLSEAKKNLGMEIHRNRRDQSLFLS